MQDEEFFRKLYAGLEVVKSQQSEINRRLGLIEKTLEDDIAPLSRVVALEDQSTRRSNWVEEGLRLVAQALVLTLAWWIASKFGVELRWQRTRRTSRVTSSRWGTAWPTPLGGDTTHSTSTRWQASRPIW
jgi:hypothetical protein